GHHAQTSLWGQVKARSGWRATRLVATDRERVVAGGQFFTRPMLLGTRVGYVTRGPLCPSDDPALADLVIGELLHACRAHHVSFLVIQPPANGELAARQLAQRGFRPGWFELAPTATVLIDLLPDVEEILARMKRNTRQNIRRGEKRGIQVREGQESDLSAFHRLYAATNERYGTRPYSEQYFAEMWQILEPHGLLRLFLATYDTEPVSALLTIPFGDTVVASKLGWSGLHGDARPNDVLFWEAIKWAKAKGYRVFDFEGIHVEGAKALLEGRPLPEELHETPTRFKLSFGGKVVLYPGPYEYVRHRPLGWLYNAVKARLAAWPWAHQQLLSYVQSM
ncbi:MAG: peptidoglycan bridge formation glycyltransferase FemA/FemB family protein, partial [Anaerolineae bacterium]|nr:peptidoglycan bridge formation glycyltransferase FemA/FemB family protein [Anaerolineae bacterium]